jgi:hypothetical protein
MERPFNPVYHEITFAPYTPCVFEAEAFDTRQQIHPMRRVEALLFILGNKADISTYDSNSFDRELMWHSRG